MAVILKFKVAERKPWEVSRGHHNHRSGAGVMGDRRTKRQRTRAAVKRAAMSEF